MAQRVRDRSQEHPEEYYEAKSEGSKYAKSARDYESGGGEKGNIQSEQVIRFNERGEKRTWINAAAADKSGYTFGSDPTGGQAPTEQPQEDVIRLGGKGDDVIDLRTTRENPLDTLLDRAIAKNPVLQAITSPITTAALATTLVVAGGAAALGSFILGGTAATTTTTAGSTLIVAANAKNVVLTTGVLAKAGVSSKALVLFGGWASAVFLGKWGQAEAGEPLSIIMRDVMKQAEETGDWSLYDEAKTARDEITDLALWEKIALWSPLSPLVGITNKIRGVLAGAQVIDKLARDKQLKQLTGESDDDKWERIRQEEADSDKGMIDYYNDERKKMVEWEQEARTDQRDDDARFWRKERTKQDAKEKISQEENAQFWTDYRKETIKLEEEAAAKSADFWLDYQRAKQDIQTGGTGAPGPQGPPGAPGLPGAPAPTGTSRTYQPASSLQFGLLKSGGGYKTEEEEKKKKKKK